MVCACDAKRGTLHWKEGDGNESTREKEERRPKRRWLDRVNDDITKRRDCQLMKCTTELDGL